ncbi:MULTISPECIES: phage integrase N-terminal SAM-like domain-containing protein [Paenibacillus]|uniref:tyrosine-type recombinase/integrase n=1 Tax=Paenibacillus TaxID=44249 RepID=UPI000FD88708|nr:phage integrase N-terminal SAM-like domain-containing protein [Paenibacillus amylolyticus]
MLLEDVYREFLFDLEIKNYSVRTNKGYRNNNRAFLNFLCNEFAVIEIEEVSTSHIKAYLMNLKKKGLSESYINGIQKNIRSFFKFILEEGYIAEKRNPVLGLKWLKQPKIFIQTFDDDEVKRMISAFKGDYYLSLRNKLIPMLFVDLEIRNLELCTLATLDVRDSVIKIYGKGNKERNLYISPFLKKYIIKYERVKEAYFKDKMMTDSNFFLSQNGRVLTVTAMKVIVKKAGKEALLERGLPEDQIIAIEVEERKSDVCSLMFV